RGAQGTSFWISSVNPCAPCGSSFDFMRIAYLDCFSGISGDMFLGALVDAGVSPKLLEDTVAAIDIGARLEISRVLRGGISATKVDVYANGDDHGHGRSLSEIRRIIEAAAIGGAAKITAIRIFQALGEVEAEIHNTSVEQVHFHEIGAVDAMVDIVGAAV